MQWSDIPSLSALRALEATIRNQSFSKAARELNVTHAAIAQHVRALEAEFSQSLVLRQGRGVVGTELGQRLAAGLNDGFSTIGSAVDDLRRTVEERPLNVTLTPVFASNWLMPRMGEFWSKHPDISVNLNPSNRLVDLREDGFDLAIRHGRGDWPGMEAKLLTGVDYWAVGAPKLLGNKPMDCLSDLIDLPWLIEEHMLELRRVIALSGVDLDTVELKVLSTNSLVISGVKAGLGVTVQPRSLVEDDVKRGELQKVCALEHSELGYFTVVLPGRSPRGLREFMKWLHSAA